MSSYVKIRRICLHAHRTVIYIHQCLLDLVFPWVDDLLSKVTDAAWVQEHRGGQSAYAEVNFLKLLKLLKWLKTVFLQDMAVVAHKHPDNRLFHQHPELFASQ